MFTALGSLIKPNASSGRLELNIALVNTGQGKYYEALVSEIDPEAKTVTASFPDDAGLDKVLFIVPYDILILGGSPLSHLHMCHISFG